MAKPRVPKKTNGDAAADASILVAASSSPETAVAEPKKSVRKPSIVKNNDRTNLFPINVDEEIRRLAYLMSERRGFEPGHETEDWLAAEREIQQRYRQHSA